ncbi:hypothetical protein [Candidatus Enterococcus clewellii]|uniref:DNA-binding protein n=1 Tax=Candidatus Enterococcus clewellii TaxID=1834193 RepID=A0A242K7V3_9ENTE|nr:hypothetical protein [Enterococcus sp. 9E7_DIV0242]OTP17255.1 hypothetical protein A5888_001393 [Enterococcus sp. 9E7_DIV0242]
MNENDSNVFSRWFENKLLDLVEKLFNRFMSMKEQQTTPAGFIKQKNALKFYDGIDAKTLSEYEALGLKRCEPIEGGNVFYEIAELKRFMRKYQTNK